jgi:hypothetical protein
MYLYAVYKASTCDLSDFLVIAYIGSGEEDISKVLADSAIYNDSHQAARLSAYVSTGGFKLI